MVNRPIIQKIWAGIANVFIPKTQGAYTVCESLKEIFSDKYSIDFEVIRNLPFSKIRKVKKQDKERKIILYQGALNEGRGLEEMIAAMPELVSCELWLAGEGDLSLQLREQTQKIGVEERVKFLGLVFPEKLAEITAQADIGLNLLKNSGLNYYYSLANKTFDYIQAGIPAIHMNFPEYQIVNEQYNIGILISDSEIKTIQSAILELIENQNLYEQLQENCNQAAQKLTWENEEKKLITFYNQFI